MNWAAISWWTVNHELVILNALLAAAALVTAIVGVKTIHSSNEVSAAATAQAEETKRLADLGRDQLEQEKQSLLTSFRPLLADVPLGVFINADRASGRGRDQGAVTWLLDPQTETFRVVVPIRNIGKGPAFIRDALFNTGPGQVFEGTFNRKVLPVGELGDAILNVPATAPLHPAIRSQFDAGVGRISVVVRYTDLGGDQRSQSVLHVVRVQSPQVGVNVAQVAIYSCDEAWVRSAEPIVVSGLNELPWI